MAKSRITIIAEKLLAALEARAEAVLKEFSVPPGYEEIPHWEYKRRFEAMSQEERLAEIDRLGVDGVLAAIKRGG